MHRFHSALVALLLTLGASLMAAPAAAHHGGGHPAASAASLLAAAPGAEVAEIDPAALDGDAGYAADKAYVERELIDVDYIFWEAVWSIIAFLIFFAVLATVVWPKVLAALQARENKQRADLKAAEHAAQKAEASLADYNRQLAEARTEAAGIVEQSRASATQVAAGVRADMERETAQMRERAAKEIAAAKESAMADIYEQAAELSTAIAGKILGREITPADQQALVTESIQQMDASRN